MSELTRSSSFETERLHASDWRTGDDAGSSWPSDGLVSDVMRMLTPAVTANLPVGWQGKYSRERAAEWIGERDAESTVLAVAERDSRRTIGLILLSEDADGEGGSAPTEVRLGYLLAEDAWGSGYASEMVAGVVEWLRSADGAVTLLAGVDRSNVASVRVLEKCGFERVQDGSPEHELLYRLSV